MGAVSLFGVLVGARREVRGAHRRRRPRIPRASWPLCRWTWTHRFGRADRGGQVGVAPTSRWIAPA